MDKIVIVQNIFLLVWVCGVLVHGTGLESLDFELIDEIEMMCADINTDNFYPDYSGILDSPSRVDWQNDASDVRQSMLQEEQALESAGASRAQELSNAVNTVGINEDSSASLSLSLPSTSSNSNSNSGTGSAISSVQVQPSAGSAKRACDRAEKKDRKHGTRKRQKTNTTATSTTAEANTALMDETEVRMAVEKFGRYFGDGAKISGYMPQGMVGFAEDLAQRGLTSAYSNKIVVLCMASEQWLGHSVFWRMLLFFMDTMSLALEIATSNRLEDKKTIVLRDRKIRDKPLSECAYKTIYNTINRCRDAERMEMQCSLNVLEGRGTEDVVGVFRWLLHHVNIKCVGLPCDLTEAGMNREVLGRQMASLTKEWRGTRVCIDSLSLRFNFTQYKDAAEIINQCSWVTVLKIHFIDADLCQGGDSIQALEALLLHCPALEELSVFEVRVGVEHIRTIAAMLPQLVLLEVGGLSLEKLGLYLEEEKEFRLVFPGLKTLKVWSLYNYSCSGIEKFMELFPSLKYVQISAKNVVIPLIDVLSSLRLLRSLEIINGSLEIETAKYLLERLPALECLAVGVKELDRKLAHALSKTTNMHTLKLRGYYIPGFLASLLQPSPLMTTLKVLTLSRNIGTSYRRDNFSTEDTHSKKAAMKNFRCAVEIR